MIAMQNVFGFHCIATFRRAVFILFVNRDRMSHFLYGTVQPTDKSGLTNIRLNKHVLLFQSWNTQNSGWSFICLFFMNVG